MSPSLLVAVLREPALLATLPLPGWELLLRQAGAANLTLTLRQLINDLGLLEAVPAQPRAHLEWVRVIGERHGNAVRFEVAQIARALEDTGLPCCCSRAPPTRWRACRRRRGACSPMSTSSFPRRAWTRWRRR